jgi:ribosomal-protein-alanine N-acetyltransferase
VRQVTLEVRESNSSAIRLYNKHGFSVKGKRKGYYKNPVEDALIMGLDREGL